MTQSADIAHNNVVDLMLKHTSVRNYLDKPVAEEICQAILQAAFAASSSCFLQVTSVIRVKDPAKRKLLAKYAGNQPHVEAAPEFWVFVADFHRNLALVPESDLGWAEQLIVGCQDTGIVAQNAFLAMESFGLGGVYIGGLRNSIYEVSELLGLPKHTLPVMGLAFGYPEFVNEIKPRLPLSVTVMTDRYTDPDSQELKAYGEKLSNYYATRGRNPKNTTWQAEVRAIMGRERRPFVDDFLKDKGWLD